MSGEVTRLQPSTKKIEAGIIILAQGNYAQPLIAAAEAFVGPLGVEIIEAPLEEDPSALRIRILNCIRSKNQGGGVLILTDLCGSTPSNVCLSLIDQEEEYEMLSGLNLPMLVKLSTCSRQDGVRILAKQLQVTSQRSVVTGTDLLSTADQK